MFSGIQHIGGGKAEKGHGAIRHFTTDERGLTEGSMMLALLRITMASARMPAASQARIKMTQTQIIFRQRNKQTIRRFDAMANVVLKSGFH